ncbi:MAG TPA: carboxypeptidase regulatory-like domain-containing protein, partial [Terriglobia bacterium]|nr:carboxypeptidase regulatory-like domain-containing protein [Terriglobia bacterium]
GTVADSSGALIPGVTITVTNTGTGIVNTAITNEAGAYQFANLQNGTYKLQAELPGFQTQVVNSFALGVAQQARLNFTLQVGTVSQTVEVSTDFNTELKTTSASVGTVLPQSQLQDLPLGSRNIQNLLLTMAGTGPQSLDLGSDGSIEGNFAGGRTSAVNVTRDGFVNSDGRYTHGEFSQTYTSPDLVEEVKVVTAGVDAENGRGAGQVQMVTRSGTNSFKGAAFWTNRNSALDANSFFNNLRGVGVNFENRNQFGFRVGGPIIKNKTFFFFLLDEQRDLTRANIVGTVLTPQARAGIFRFFPGVNNANILSTTNAPTVDRNGNPLQPAGATGPLQAFCIYNTTAVSPSAQSCAPTISSGAGANLRDPLRPAIDPSGYIQNSLLNNMPLPNDYTVGDGLNTAGIRFTQRVYGTDVADGNSNDQNNRDQFNIRIDHNFNTKHKLSAVYTYENSYDHSGQAGLRQWPNGFDGQHDKWPRLMTFSLVSTLSSTMVNELRVGWRRSAIASWAPANVGKSLEGTGSSTGTGAKASALLPVINGIPLLSGASTFTGLNGFFNQIGGNSSTRSSRNPLWQYGDNISWTHGKHGFKAGIELRRDQTQSWNDNNMQPLATFGAAPGFSVTGIAATNIPGLTATNQTNAQSMLTDLAGSILRVQEGFDIPNATATQFLGYKDGYVSHDRDWHSNEASMFFKDDWKVRQALTLNLGIHWEYFGVPYEAKGRAALPVGGAEAGACGISCGALTSDLFVGKNSPNPKMQLYKDFYHGFAPSIGFSYSLPWLGQDKTILRGGYGINYTGGALKSLNTILDVIAGAAPGAVELSNLSGITFNPTSYTNLANLGLPIPQQFTPLAGDPINGSRSDSLNVYATNRVSPYVQNINLDLQRQVSRTLTVDVAYVASKGTHLYGGRNMDFVNINSVAGGQTFLQAFKDTAAGRDAPYFDALLKGINIGGGASTVNGTTETGSAALRQNSTTRTFLANASAGGLANYFETTNVAGIGGGGLYTQNAFPQNFFVLNPQFAAVNYFDSSLSSTYHSLQLQVTNRQFHGLSNQFTYTYSRALDISDTDGTVTSRDPNNIKLDHGRAGFDRTHIMSGTGTYDLPFGQGRTFLGSGPAWIQRLTERWGVGGIFSFSTGAPLTFTAPITSLWQTGTANTPLALQSIPSNTGKLTFVSNGVNYFPGWTQVKDPAIATLTSTNGVNTSSTNFAIQDANGRIVLQNPVAGTVGTVGRNTITGPHVVGFDVNAIKRVKVTESKDFELRLDIVNVLNHPNFGNPTMNIDSTSFGQIT